MRKVLLSIAACALATVAALVGKPWLPGTEQRAQHEQLATFAEHFGKCIVMPAGTIPATLPGSVASLGYPSGRFTPVEGDLAKLSQGPCFRADATVAAGQVPQRPVQGGG
jgi:hypothetical protein